MWFAVHVLIGFSDAEAISSEVVVEENIYVVDCGTHAEAERLGNLLGEKAAQANVSYLQPRPTKTENLGVRKVVTVSNPGLDAETAPQNETEITYEIMRFANRQDVEAYRKGEAIRATFWNEQE